MLLLAIVISIVYFTHVTCHKSISDANHLFSGFYVPNTTFAAENYGGSWLTSRHKLLMTELILFNARAMEHISLMVTGTAYDSDAVALLTRDYLDFHVEHLSSTSNMLLSQQATDRHVETLQRRLRLLKAHIEREPRYIDPAKGAADARISQQTLVVVPFNLNRVQKTSSHSSPASERLLRLLCFRVTIWSIYRYFPNIAVGAATVGDVELLRSLDLPHVAHKEGMLKVIDLSRTFHAEGHQILNYRMLPKMLILHVINLLKMHPGWSHFRYVYYTEADQPLYARSLPHAFDAIDKDRPHVSIVPHRFQTFPLLGNSTGLDQPPPDPELEEEPVFTKESDVHLNIEGDISSTGSCCDNGRFLFRPCNNFWFYCKGWGLQNYSQWLSHGAGSSYVTTCGSAHQARCTYSSVRIQCPEPPTCDADARDGKLPAYCGEIDNIEFG